MSTKTSLLQELKFKGIWRSYQQRVLNELDYHLDDSKLNIVAAPGAGKTILGIEVLRRLNNPVFILAPTITIRNQWKQRIIDNFLPEGVQKELVSTDIKDLTEITISTYQALHSLYKDHTERKIFINKAKKLGINTLILDEAHHLRTEWWATLNNLYSELNNKNFKIVSLTGTPPYDVSPAEWENYNSLCGPVDAEISIPELVKEGDLCPHQDLIYFSNLTKEEQQTVFDFEEKRNSFFKDFHVFCRIESICEEFRLKLSQENYMLWVKIILCCINLENLNPTLLLFCNFFFSQERLLQCSFYDFE